LEEVKDEALRSKFHIDKSAEKTWANNAENSIVIEEVLSIFLLHFIHTLVGPKVWSKNKIIRGLVVPGSGRIFRSTHSFMMSIDVFICEMHVHILDHVEGAQYSPPPRLVENLMGYCKLCCAVVRLYH
jgi:hypothetical protein